MKSTGYLYDIGLELRQCAHAWDGSARLLGNIKAIDLATMAGDYVRLRLAAGISNEPTIQEDSFFANEALTAVLEALEIECVWPADVEHDSPASRQHAIKCLTDCVKAKMKRIAEGES